MRNWGKNSPDPSESIPPSEWLNYFTSLLSEETSAPSDTLEKLSALEQELYFSELDYKITTTEITKALKRLNTKASPGPDKISGSFLPACNCTLMSALNLFYNKLFSLAAQPNLFSLNFLKSIFKKEDPSNPDNYRGIAIGSAIEKVFNLVILGRLEKRVIKDHLLSPNRIGFKKGHRTSDHIFVLNSMVKKIVRNEKRKLFVAFIDFKKPFDKVNRDLLFFKLQTLGIKGLLYQNIKEMYQSIYYI